MKWAGTDSRKFRTLQLVEEQSMPRKNAFEIPLMKTKLTPLILVTTALGMAHGQEGQFPSVYPAPVSGQRLSPPIAAAPSLNGAKVYGARPGSEMLYKVAVSGERPMKIVAHGLPNGLKISEYGVISGRVARAGSYPVRIVAENAAGRTEGTVTIKVGEDLCLTPPMGWNSWYSYSEAVSQDAIEKVARLFHDKGLVEHGWSYVNIDDCWQGRRGGDLFAIQPNKKFRDMKAMCDTLHGLGLKVGIYSSPWMGTYAGFTGGSAPNAKADFTGLALPEKDWLQEGQIFGRYPGLHKQKVDRVGPVWMFDKDAKQWARWGFDYVKVDWNPNDVPTTKRIDKDLRASGRDIVLSLSNAAPFENMEGLSVHSNLWRTTGDIQDNWGSISRIGFSQDKWQKYTRPGHWNDPDMLQIGKIGQPNRPNVTFKQTGLTPDEEYLQVSLWCLLSAPLIISCDLENIDDFTMGLLTNDEVIAVNQDVAAKPAVKAWSEGPFQVWTKELEDGTLAAGFFNTGNEKAVCTVDLSSLGLKGPQHVRDLWKRESVGKAEGKIAVELNPHGVTMFRFKVAK